MKLIKGVRVKYELYPTDVLNLYTISYLINDLTTSAVKGRGGFMEKIEIVYYLRQMVKTLTHTRFPLLHIRKIPHFIKHFDLEKKQAVANKKTDPIENLNSIIRFISISQNIPYKDVSDKTPFNQLTKVLLDLAKKQISKLSNLISVHHSPKELLKRLNREDNKIKMQERQRPKRINKSKEKVVDFEEEKKRIHENKGRTRVERMHGGFQL